MPIGFIDYRFFQWLRDDGTGSPIIYDKSGNPLLKVVQGTGETIIYGGGGTGDNLRIKANQTNAYPEYLMTGNNTFYLSCNTGQEIIYRDATTVMERHSYASNITSIVGGSVTGDDLFLFGSNADIYPVIKLFGNGNLEFVSSASHNFKSGANLMNFMSNDGSFHQKETGVQPTDVATYGCLWAKNDDTLHWIDGGGVDHTLAFV